MTGLELKLKRVAADVKGKDVADAMGVTAGQVSRLESSRSVTPESEARYLAALSTCITNSTEGPQRAEVA